MVVATTGREDNIAEEVRWLYYLSVVYFCCYLNNVSRRITCTTIAGSH